MFVLKIVIGRLVGTVSVIADVEKAQKISLDVESKVPVDPVPPNNPLVISPNKFLEKYMRNVERITDFHDIRIIKTDNHQVILIGINVKDVLKHDQMLDCRQTLETVLKEEFKDYKIDIKVSPL